MNTRQSMKHLMYNMTEYCEYMTCPHCDSSEYVFTAKPHRGFSLTCHACGHIDSDTFDNYQRVLWEWVK